MKGLSISGEKCRPGFTTLQANDKEPISDNNSRLVHFLRCDHIDSLSDSSLYLSGGSLMMRCSVSISIPRYVRSWEGPTILSGAKGTPSSRNAFLCLYACSYYISPHCLHKRKNRLNNV